MAATRRRFTQKFKDELCREVINNSKPIKDVDRTQGTEDTYQREVRGLVAVTLRV